MQEGNLIDSSVDGSGLLPNDVIDAAAVRQRRAQQIVGAGSRRVVSSEGIVGRAVEVFDLGAGAAIGVQRCAQAECLCLANEWRLMRPREDRAGDRMIGQLQFGTSSASRS